MDFLQLEWLQPILWLAGIAIGLWVIPNKWWAKLISFFGTKLVPAMNKVEDLLRGGASIATSAGLEKIGSAIDAAADSVDELEDLPRLLVEYQADGEIDPTELKSLIEEAGEAGVSVKVLVSKIVALIKKKPE